jgi:hypothetical protein
MAVIVISQKTSDLRVSSISQQETYEKQYTRTQ